MSAIRRVSVTAPPPQVRATAGPGHPDEAGRRFDAQVRATAGAGHPDEAGRRFDAQVVAMAGPSHAVFALAELTALGVSARAVQLRVDAARLHRVHRGVYALVPAELLTARGRDRAATLACTGSRHPATLSHRSAADLHGLRQCRRRVVEVIVPGRSTHRHPGIQVHRSIHLDLDADVVGVHGIATTTIARTLLDLASVVSRRELERALDQAEILRVFDLDALRGQIARNPRHPGGGALRATLGRHVAGSTVTDSELEERMRAFVDAHGLPQPQLHAPVDPGDGGVIVRPDFVWRDRRLAVEVDGVGTHLTRRAFEDDRARDQRLTAAGWRVIRITWRQLTERPHEIAAILRRLLVS